LVLRSSGSEAEIEEADNSRDERWSFGAMFLRL